MLAAAGPQGIVIANTDAVRKAYYAESSGGDETKTLTAELQIPFPGQISHLAFNSSEDALVVAAQEGGLAVYEVARLGQGNPQPSITLPLNGQSLRSLVPNPEAPELVAAVTSNGELLIANLKDGQLVQGPSGPVMRNNVSCIVWSNKGKQLVAGLVDGTAFQLTPEGQEKAAIPRPPDLEGNQHSEFGLWFFFRGHADQIMQYLLPFGSKTTCFTLSTHRRLHLRTTGRLLRSTLSLVSDQIILFLANCPKYAVRLVSSGILHTNSQLVCGTSSRI